MPDQIPPILRDFPDHFESARILLRAPRQGDGAVANIAIRESVEELKLWMPWAQAAPTVEDTETVYRRGASEWLTRTNLPLLLFRKSDGLFLGGSGLHRMNWAVPSFEIGYWLRTSMTGQGYMTEAVIALTQFSMEVLGANRMEIRCDARNERSAAVARRSGYTLESHMHHNDRDVNGELCDTLFFVKFP